MLFETGEWTSSDFPCEILEVMQGGHMAELYIAKLKNTHHKVVVKAAADDGSVYKEGVLLSGLRCQGVPQLFACFQEKKRSYYIMSLHQGRNLEQYAAEGHMPVQKVKRIGLELCHILSYLHSDQIAVVHNDLKPANILFSEKGKVTLVDFGLAEVYTISKKRDVKFQGTLGYAAPECWHRERGQISPAADIFALGATMFYLLEGRSPKEYYGKFILSDDYFENKQKKNSWQAVLDKCCALDKHRRFQSAVQVYEALEKLET